MKRFEVELSRHECRSVEVDAIDRDDAVRLARLQLPGFSAEMAAEIVPGDAGAGVEHVVNTSCEACGCVIWQGDAYHGGEDVDLCMRCGAD